jgi:ABC-type transport system substrate-binding protein
MAKIRKFSLSGKRKWPFKSQWRQFFKVLSKKEKITFLVFLVLFLGSFTFLILNFYFKNTKIGPARGGNYIEGLMGQPRFINPVYANSDVDRDLVQLIFSGLMKYDKNLQIVPDLVENYEIGEEGKVYKFYLKENISWQDKTPLTADDIIFTIKTIQDQNYKSPLRPNWVGVEVEKINDSAIRFKLQKPYSAFLENCTVKILPKHIWENVSSENFPLEIHNLKPIGSGPYKLKEINQDKSNQIKSLTLVPNPLYYDQSPYISEIKFLFFENEEELIKATRSGKIKGLSLNSYKDLGQNWQSYFLSLPRYFAVFFNSDKSEILSEKEVRLALNYGTNKKEIIKKILDLPGDSPILDKVIVNSPILPKIYGFDPPSIIYEFNIEEAKNILEEAGFKDENQDGPREKTIEKETAFTFKSDLKLKSQGKEVEELQRCLAKFPDVYPEGEITGYFGEKTKQAVINFQEKYAEDILEPWGFAAGTGIISKTTRSKLNEICFEKPEKTLPLKFSLLTVDQPRMVEVANLLKEQWRALGAEVEIKKFPISQLEQEFIKPRNYEALLFGEVLGAIPDPLPFWHSSQKKDPGLNLAIYENKEVDKLLEEIRESSDLEVRAEKLITFQNILIGDVPAIFLYCPDHIYLVSKEIKGIDVEKIVDPSKRFSGVENWYIKTKRTWK